MRKIKKKFIPLDHVPKHLNNEKLIFYGYYKNKDGLTTCIATRENGKKIISFGRKISTADLFEVEKYFKIDSYKTYFSGVIIRVFCIEEIEAGF